MDRGERKVSFSVKIPCDLVEEIRRVVQERDTSIGDWVTESFSQSLKNPQEDRKPESLFDFQPLADRLSFLESSIAEIKAAVIASNEAGLRESVTTAVSEALRSIPDPINPPSLEEIRSSQDDLKHRIEEISSEIGKLEMMFQETIRSIPQAESPENALSLLSIQVGDIRHSLETVSEALQRLTERGPSASGAVEGLQEVKSVLTRLSESVSHQNAAIGEVLRIGDAVKRIEGRLSPSSLSIPVTPSSGRSKVAPKTAEICGIPVSEGYKREIETLAAKDEDFGQRPNYLGWLTYGVLCVAAVFLGLQVTDWIQGTPDSNPVSMIQPGPGSGYRPNPLHPPKSGSNVPPYTWLHSQKTDQSASGSSSKSASDSSGSSISEQSAISPVVSQKNHTDSGQTSP